MIKYFGRVYNNQREFLDVRDIHVLEDLAGGLVIRKRVLGDALCTDTSLFYKMKSTVNTGLPVICRKYQVSTLSGQTHYNWRGHLRLRFMVQIC